MSITFLDPTELCSHNPKRKCFCSVVFRPRILKTMSCEIQSTTQLMFRVQSPDDFNCKKNVMESGGFSSSSPRSSTLGGQVFCEYDSNFLRVLFLNIFAEFLASLHLGTLKKLLPQLMFYFLGEEK